MLPVRLVAVEGMLARAQRPPAGTLRHPREEQSLDGLSLCGSIGTDVAAARLLPAALAHHMFRVVAVQKLS